MHVMPKHGSCQYVHNRVVYYENFLLKIDNYTFTRTMALVLLLVMLFGLGCAEISEFDWKQCGKYKIMMYDLP